MARRVRTNGRARGILDFARENGWQAEVTNGGHLRLTWKDKLVFAAASPSDHRAQANAIAMMRRAMRESRA